MVTVRNQPEGGACFTVRLPLAPIALTAPERAPPEELSS